MSLVDRMIAAAQRALPAEEAAAHCDIPCGIYDPHAAQIAAHTVIRMVDLIEGLGELNSTEKLHTFNRHVQVKEEHGRIAEQEIIILWTDYFKPEHLEKHQNLHDLFWNATKEAGAAKKSEDPAQGQKLLDAVDEIAKVFWETKS